MRKIYICSPLRGNVGRNIENARRYARYVVRRCGAIPVAPHLYFTRFLNDDSPEEREFGIQAGLELLRMCEVVWVFGTKITEGMRREIEFAREIGIPVGFIGTPRYAIYRWREEME